MTIEGSSMAESTTHNADSGDRLLRIDMTTQTIRDEPYPEKWRLLGGRALSSRVLLEECDPECDPLGPDNVLVFAPGVLAGTSAPTSGRLSVGAKSPMTGGSKEANTGGNPGQHITKLGYRCIIVTGQPADENARFGVELDSDGARIVPADDLRGVWNYPACETLSERYPKQTSFIICGPAGEQRLCGASVGTTDQDNRYPTRHAARGGLGAVMGSKGLKFLSVDPGRAKLRRPADAKAFTALVKGFSKEYMSGPRRMSTGTATAVPMANMMHTFPSRNRISGQFEHADALDGQNIHDNFAERGGGMHNCLTGCIVQCSNVVHGPDGKYLTSALEFETITMLGANCAIGDLDEVARLDRLCDDVGLDTIETGSAIAIYMDAGKMEFGDSEGAKRLIREIGEGTELGKIIGDGADTTGRATNHPRVPTVRGQSIPAWDPRPLLATGVTYASSAQGADHTAGLVTDTGLEGDALAHASQTAQITNAICDASGFCMFISPPTELIRKFYSAFFGQEVTPDEIVDHGWQILQDEWAFNDRAGTPADDEVMPDCMKTDPVGANGDQVFDVDAEIIAKAKIRSVATADLISEVAVG
jgi:aldehyde:ferredoxin oxidoreductase